MLHTLVFWPSPLQLLELGQRRCAVGANESYECLMGFNVDATLLQQYIICSLFHLLKLTNIF